jgi:hypothetical protein
MVMNRSPWLCVLAAAAACGSTAAGSGVAASKRLNGLSTGERDQLCAYGAEVEQAPRSVMCGMTQVTLKDKAACVASLGTVTVQCQATVGDAELCFQALGDDPCSLGVGACTALYTCVLPIGRAGD